MKREVMLQYLNSAFEIYTPDHVFIDKIDGPGDVGGWLRTPEAPDGVAIIPVPFESFNKAELENPCYRVIRIYLDDNLEEMPDQRQELTMVAYPPGSDEEAKKLARKYQCDHMYWSAWDGPRYMFWVELETDINLVYCFDED